MWLRRFLYITFLCLRKFSGRGQRLYLNLLLRFMVVTAPAPGLCPQIQYVYRNIKDANDKKYNEPLSGNCALPVAARDGLSKDTAVNRQHDKHDDSPAPQFRVVAHARIVQPLSSDLYEYNKVMRNLNSLTKATASYHERERDITAVVWMPGTLRRTGILRAHTHTGAHTSQDAFGWISSMRHFRLHTSLGPVLKYLGIEAELKAPADIEMTFRHPEMIAERAAQLNETLPQEHKLPKIAVYRGATIPGNLFLESVVDDTVLLADGGPRPWWRKMGRDALIAAHDIAFHLPSRLAMDPGSRAALGRQAGNALADPGEPDDLGLTRIDNLAAGIDRFVGPPNMGPAKFGDPHDYLIKEVVGTETVLFELSNFEVGGTRMPRGLAAGLGQLSVAHVNFLGQHVAGLH